LFNILVTGITRNNAIVEYLDYQIPVTQEMGPKGNRDMQRPKGNGDMQAPKANGDSSKARLRLDRFKRYGRYRCGRDQSIGIDETSIDRY